MSNACRLEMVGRLYNPKAMKTTTLMLIATLMMTVLVIPIDSKCQSHAEDSIKKVEELIMKQINILQHKYGEGRIILKDRGIYKKTKIHQLNHLWLVYIKNGSTHDLMIEKIARIEIGKEKQAIVTFDNKGRARIR